MVVEEIIKRLKTLPKGTKICVRDSENKWNLIQVTTIEQIEVIDDVTKEPTTVWVID